MLDPQIALLVAIDKERHRAAFSQISNSSHETVILYITAITSANRWNRLIFELRERTQCTMATGAHTGDPLSTTSHSPATPKVAPRFGSYAEYLAILERSTVERRVHRSGDELWIASFDEDGRCMEWNYCDPFRKDSLDVPRCLPAPDGSGVRPHITVLPSQGFRTVLQTPDDDVAYRVVLVTAGFDAITPQTRNILGIGLDLGPEVFEYAQICVGDPFPGKNGTLPRPWHKVPPALRVGQNALCILEAGPEEAPKTGIRNPTVF